VPVTLTGDAYTFVSGTGRQLFWLTLVPQLLVWPAYTVAVGMAGAALARFLPAASDDARRAERLRQAATGTGRASAADEPCGPRPVPQRWAVANRQRGPNLV
jgi:hypothetical protein